MKLTELAVEGSSSDTITLDVPLFIRMLEWAREEAKSDIDLHQAAENAVRLSKDGCGPLRTRDYPQLVVQHSRDAEAPKVATENGKSTVGEFIAPDNRRFVHGQKYAVVKGPLQGQHVRAVARSFLKRQPDGSMIEPSANEVAVHLPNGGLGYITSDSLDALQQGSIDYTEPVRPGFPY